MSRTYTFVMAVCGFTLLSGSAFAASSAGPEPYSAPTPQYTAQASEPTLKVDKGAPPQLYDGHKIAGPAAGPEPYHAPNPS